MSDLNAPDLPESLAPGDLDAFHRAFDAYLDPLRRFVYTYVVSWEIAEDLVNDAFLQLWRQLQSGEPVRALKAYLYTAARNRAISHLRHRRVEARHLRQYLQPHLRSVHGVLPPQAEREVLARELAATIQRAVDELPGRQREVVLLKWQGHMTHEEIGRTLGIASKTVAEHFRRAVEHLRTVLPNLIVNS